MRWPEVIYQEVNKSRLADHFDKIPGERGKEVGDYIKMVKTIHIQKKEKI